MISLRKINALLVIVIILMLAYHALLNVMGMYGLISYSPEYNLTGRRLFYPFVCHIIISLYLFFKDNSRKFNRYLPLINDTVQQFISGIVIIVLIAMHILSYMYLPPIKPDVTVNTIHLVIDILLFIAIAVHLNISIPKLLVSLGFLQSKDSYEKHQKENKNCNFNNFNSYHSW